MLYHKSLQYNRNDTEKLIITQIECNYIETNNNGNYILMRISTLIVF